MAQMTATVPWSLDPSQLGETRRLAEGGHGIVFDLLNLWLPDLPGRVLVYKAYKPSIIDHCGQTLLHGLRAQVESRGNLDPLTRDEFDKQIIWPLRVVVKEDVAIGVVMKKLSDEFFFDLKSPTGQVFPKTPREVAFLLAPKRDALARGVPQYSDLARLNICRRFAFLLTLLHKLEVIVGDISFRNLVCTEPDDQEFARIVLTDTDSCRRRGSVSPLGVQPYTADWEPPEKLKLERELTTLPKTASNEMKARKAERDVQTFESDCYKFGLFIIRLLQPGRGATMTRNRAPAKSTLEHWLGRGGASRVLEALNPEPSKRPTMREILDVFAGVARPS